MLQITYLARSGMFFLGARGTAPLPFRRKRDVNLFQRWFLQDNHAMILLERISQLWTQPNPFYKKVSNQIR